jgi:uncharacterized protein (TIGR02594 family)
VQQENMSNSNNSGPPWLVLAQAEVGLREKPGPDHEARVVQFFADVGHGWVKDDETAWCAAFLGSVLARRGYPLPALNVRLSARGYLTYGVACDPQPGAIGVWPRGSNPNLGHVGFVVDVDASRETCQLLAGNQGNAVSVQTYRLDEALGFRWPVATTTAALRKAGSSEVKAADKLELAGIGGAAVAAGGAAAAELTRAPPPTVPPPAPVIDPGDLTLLDKSVAAAKAVGSLFAAHPWLAGVLLGAFALLIVGRVMKRKRVAKAAAGVPIGREIVAG